MDVPFSTFEALVRLPPPIPLPHSHAIPLAPLLAQVVPNASSILPAAYSASSDVIVARLTGSDAIGEVFGRSKIKGGSRMGSWTANRAEFVYYPQTGTADVWWTMA